MEEMLETVLGELKALTDPLLMHAEMSVNEFQIAMGATELLMVRLRKVCENQAKLDALGKMPPLKDGEMWVLDEQFTKIAGLVKDLRTTFPHAAPFDAKTRIGFESNVRETSHSS